MELYRGLANPVIDDGDLDGLLVQAGLNWEVCEAPVQYALPNNPTLSVFDGRKVLVRCDTLQPIEVTSASFQVHQNKDIVKGLRNIARASGIRLDCGGALDGGGRVFLSGSVDMKFDAGREKQVGDIVQLRYLISGGHRPGTPTTLKAQAMRLACMNGATLVASQCAVRVTHQQTLDANSVNRLVTFVENTQREFQRYEERAVKLMGTSIPYAVNQAFVLELLQDDLLEKVVRENSVITSNRANRFTGAQILEEILERSERGLLSPMQLAANSGKVGRTASEVLRVLNTQPGSDTARGTLWNAYNAVTYHVDHVRGRQADTAVESSLFGEGDRLKNSALELAMEYTERLQTLGVRA